MGKMVPLVVCLVLASLILFALPMLADAPPPEGRTVARLHFDSVDAFNAVAAELDVWQVVPGAGLAIVALRPEQHRWLEDLGYRVEVDDERTSILGASAALDPRFYYFDQQYTNENSRYIVDFLHDTNAAYPGVTELLDIGDAWAAGHGGEHRDIWVLRITNEDPSHGDIISKPVFFFLSAIHAREVAAPELAIRYIRYLTSGNDGQGGYGLDPDVTWLVDHHVAYILVMLNPDGHRVNEAGTSAYWRKNVNDDECATGEYGVDLNRNHSFFWGQAGSSSSACSETYRGPSQASEPELLAFQDFFSTVMVDQNGPNGDAQIPPAAPDDATGIFISLHTYGDLVLWPWAHTTTKAPNSDQLQTIGRKLAYHNGYQPQQATDLYFASGTSDDWTYGKYGLASFTFEAGTGYPFPSGSCEGFFPDYECIDTAGPDGTGSIWPENLPAFLYAHKIARTPYLTARGPDALDVGPNLSLVAQGQPLQLVASIDDTRFNQSNGIEPTQLISAAEYYVDVPPWSQGAGPVPIPMQAADGSFDAALEAVQATHDTAGLPLGRHTVYVRGQDAAGNWGAVTAIFVTITSGQNPTNLHLDVSPSLIHIVHGQAAITATLTLSDGTPAPGWIVSFDSSLGTVSPPAAYTGADGLARAILHAGDISGTAALTTGAAGLVTGPLTVTLDVPAAPTAAFLSNSPVCEDVTVVLTNTSLADPSVPAAYLWDLGDGSSSSQVSPQYQYDGPGTYFVSLKASNVGGSHTYSDTVVVNPLPVAGWDVYPLSPQPGQQVQFVDRSDGDPETWSWDLGEGAISSMQNPTYSFPTTGTYTVTLVVANDCGWSQPHVAAVDVGLGASVYRHYLPFYLRSEP